MIKIYKKKFRLIQIIILTLAVFFSSYFVYTGGYLNSPVKKAKAAEQVVIQAGYVEYTVDTPRRIDFPDPNIFTEPPIVITSEIRNRHIYDGGGIALVTSTGFNYTNYDGIARGMYWIAVQRTIPLAFQKYIQTGFQNNPGSSPVTVQFAKKSPTTFQFEKDPIVVASRNWYGAEQETIRVYQPTRDQFSYQGDGDEWPCVLKETGSGINWWNIPGGCTSPLTTPAGVYWVAISPDLLDKVDFSGTFRADFHPNTPLNGNRVVFDKYFTDTEMAGDREPIVVASRNWFGQGENMISISSIALTNFYYEGDGTDWKFVQNQINSNDDNNCGVGLGGINPDTATCYLAGINWFAIKSGVTVLTFSVPPPPPPPTIESKTVKVKVEWKEGTRDEYVELKTILRDIR